MENKIQQYVISIFGCTIEEYNRIQELLQKNMGFKPASSRIRMLPVKKENEELRDSIWKNSL